MQDENRIPLPSPLPYGFTQDSLSRKLPIPLQLASLRSLLCRSIAAILTNYIAWGFLHRPPQYAYPLPLFSSPFSSGIRWEILHTLITTSSVISPPCDNPSICRGVCLPLLGYPFRPSSGLLMRMSCCSSTIVTFFEVFFFGVLL